MKRKKTAQDELVVSPRILEEAKRSVVTDQAKPAASRPCGVCGDDVAPNSAEDLCWVCRRLKISAWRDMDYQMPSPD